jgi:hypothetical protein
VHAAVIKITFSGGNQLRLIRIISFEPKTFERFVYSEQA